MCCVPVNQIPPENGELIGQLIGIRINIDGECQFIIKINDDYECQNSGMDARQTSSFYLIHRNDTVYKVECLRCKKMYWIFHKPEPLFSAVCQDCANGILLVGVLTGVSSQGFGKEALFTISFEDFTCHMRSGMTFCQAQEFYEKNKSCRAYNVECADCKEKFWVFKKPILLQSHICNICSVPK